MPEVDYPHTLHPLKSSQLTLSQSTKDVLPADQSQSFTGFIPAVTTTNVTVNKQRPITSSKSAVPETIATQSTSSFSALINQFLKESSKENQVQVIHNYSLQYTLNW